MARGDLTNPPFPAAHRIRLEIAGSSFPLANRHWFSKLRQFRAVATRYDKRDFMCQGIVDVASIRIWLRDPAS